MGSPSIWQQRIANNNREEFFLIDSASQKSFEFIMNFHHSHVESFVLFVYLRKRARERSKFVFQSWMLPCKIHDLSVGVEQVYFTD